MKDNANGKAVKVEGDPNSVSKHTRNVVGQNIGFLNFANSTVNVVNVVICGVFFSLFCHHKVLTLGVDLHLVGWELEWEPAQKSTLIKSEKSCFEGTSYKTYVSLYMCII